MTTTILPELARETTESVRRALDRQIPGTLTAREVGGALSLCLSVRDLIRQEWWALQDQLSQGVETRTFQDGAEHLVETVDAHLATINSLREAARQAKASSDEKVGEEGELDSLEKEIREVRQSLGQALELAKRPSGPVDMKVLEEARSACERGEFETVDDVLARLKAGGEL
jgi:hypothetical protein